MIFLVLTLFASTVDDLLFGWKDIAEEARCDIMFYNYILKCQVTKCESHILIACYAATQIICEQAPQNQNYGGKSFYANVNHITIRIGIVIDYLIKAMNIN